MSRLNAGPRQYWLVQNHDVCWAMKCFKIFFSASILKTYNSSDLLLCFYLFKTTVKIKHRNNLLKNKFQLNFFCQKKKRQIKTRLNLNEQASKDVKDITSATKQIWGKLQLWSIMMKPEAPQILKILTSVRFHCFAFFPPYCWGPLRITID